MNHKRIVVALGGNALQKSGEASANAQEFIADQTAKKLVPLIKDGHEIVLVHGNGPQIGDILLHEELSGTKDNPAMPIDSCVAMSQGSIGYWLQQALDNELTKNNIDKLVASIVTQVVVDKDDTAFRNPTKPIGPFYKTKEEALLVGRVHDAVIKRDANRGWRRVVASPQPISIVEEKIVDSLIKNDYLVIANGGGGVPVYKDAKGALRGIEAVIDKDYSAALLADSINADVLLILTNVDGAIIHYGQYDQTILKEISCEKIEGYCNSGEFATGSMLPKVRASIDFVRKKRGYRKAIIASLEKSIKLGNGQQGTIIT